MQIALVCESADAARSYLELVTGQLRKMSNLVPIHAPELGEPGTARAYAGDYPESGTHVLTFRLANVVVVVSGLDLPPGESYEIVRGVASAADARIRAVPEQLWISEMNDALRAGGRAVHEGALRQSPGQ